MGVFPMVRWKNSSSIRSEVTKRSEGRRRSSFPNLKRNQKGKKQQINQSIDQCVKERRAERVFSPGQNSVGANSSLFQKLWRATFSCQTSEYRITRQKKNQHLFRLSGFSRHFHICLKPQQFLCNYFNLFRNLPLSCFLFHIFMTLLLQLFIFKF